MASSTSTLTRQNGLRLLPAIARLSLWRFAQMWRFLFFTWLGMLAMVVLVCALPLFSRVAVSADLRSLTASAPDGHNIMVQVASSHPTPSQIQQIAQQLDHTLRQGTFGSYLQGTPQFVEETPPVTLIQVGKALPASLSLSGYDLTQATSHINVMQGRLPQATTDGSIEIAIAQDTASTLNLHVGSVVQGTYPVAVGSQVWTLRVVGIIAPATAKDGFWAATNPFGSRQTFSGGSGSTVYSVLGSLEVLQPRLADLQTPSANNLGKGALFSSTRLYWRYPFNLAHLDANDIAALSQQASDLRSNLPNTLSQIQDTLYGFPFGTLIGALQGYPLQNLILEIVVTILLVIILGIVLFLVSMLSDMLVERQAAVIATLRSRGATRRHIFGTFVVQGILLSLAALLIGPLLAIQLVREIAQALLSPANQSSLTVITANPVQAALGVKWFAVVAVVVALFVMMMAIRRASKQDIVSLRHESSRTKRVPLWRRLNLDLLVVVLMLVGYVAYTYFWQSLASAQQLNIILYNVLQGLAFLAPPLLVAAVLMLFLRVFPLILRLATKLAAKKRSASAVLAFAQMERAPRPAARIVILLALAIASSCFLSTLIMTKQARTSDAATFNVGADFSGLLPASDATKTFSALQTEYSTMPGVQSATIGHYETLELDPANPLTQSASGVIRISAVDADTYAHTALWSTVNSSDPLSNLTASLVAHRPDAGAQNVVYALVDAAGWQQLHLTPGASFTLPVDSSGSLQMHFIALAPVNYIPGIYDSPLAASNGPGRGIGLLVDYQSYATVYNKVSGTVLAPNSVMLRTQDDAVTLANIRSTLPGLSDRRAAITDNQENTIHLDIVGVLAIGVGAALILALMGTLLSSWLNASNRRTNFAVLRAMGMAPRQIASVLLWEQGFVYILAFLLGTGLGAMLSTFTAPIVSLLDLATNQGNPYDVPPVQMVIPSQQLSLMLGGLVLICLLALLLMARIVSRPSISQTLRLNED